MPDVADAWLGLDLGTQSVRALAVTADGRRLATASRALTSVRNGRRHEQDPHDWWTATVAVLREVTGALGGRTVGGLAACVTSGTVLLTDPDGRPRTPGLMYDDSRAADRPGVLDAVLTEGAALWQALGHRPQVSWALPKLAYLRATGAFPAGSRVAHQGDHVLRHLAGEAVATDSSQALKTGLDTRTLRWPGELLDRLGLDPRDFPDAVLPGTPIGTVCAAAAELTGVPAGTALLAGTTDGCAAQFAAGAVRPGDWNSVLGTTLVIKGVSTAPVREPTGTVYNHRSPYAGQWLPGGASSTGAGIVAALFDDATLSTAQRELPPWSAVPVAYPLHGTGERFPFQAPDATGVVGTPHGTVAIGDAVTELGPATALAAVLLGVACVERLCYDLLDLAGAAPVRTVTVTGGGTRNPAWNRLRCDMLGVPVHLPDYPEPVLGAALLAASPAGDLAQMSARMTTGRTVLEPSAPDPALTAAYHRFLDLLRDQGRITDALAGHALHRSTA